METTGLINSRSCYPFDFKHYTILIVEDVDFNFIYLEAVLRCTGVKIIWAKNGKEAVEIVIANTDIDLILMDMYMPVMDGYEATAVISKLRPGLPIVAQTAYCLPEDIKKCYAAGCISLLSKPIRKELLINTLAEYFERIEQATIDVRQNKARIG
jgi:CheY-like chemotaxis protein